MIGVNKWTTSKMNVKINSESSETQQQVVSFADQTEQWTYSIDNQLDDVHRTVDSNDADLNNFFSRPIKIASINWTVGSTFGTTINPWQLYFENLRVINRITNYNVMRSKLCVRIMINGNGFHYGRALASYRPLHNDDGMVAWRYGLVPQDTIAASQRMHVWIDPTKSQGGTLCLPYVYYKNAMSVPEQDWREMGELDIASVTTLEHANGGTDSVTISVFAWAEDVALSVPTIAEPGALAPQALEQHANEADMASKGPISGPAAAVAKVAGTLKSVPMISKWATATEMAANATGTLARAFGMSKPVDTGPIQSYKPTYTGNMANTNVLDTSTKLTYDVKQELTIDPVATGLGPADEMSISSIASRESYLTQFQWQTTDVPETLLWNSYVSPMLFDTAAPTLGTEYHYTPMAYAALPFENWRGTIKYRFQVVASSFHKGRLKIIYEPYYNPLGASEYNVQYTHVIDLAKERDFTVEIDWGQEYSFLDHRDLGTIGSPFSTSFLTGARHGQVNGLIGVYVVNDLTTPSATLSDVSVLVSVCAGDDFEVVNPSNNLRQVTFWQPQAALEEQSDMEVADADFTTEESAPVSADTEITMSQPLHMENNAQRIYYGDPVTSVRQVLKRYYPYRAWCSTSTAGDSVMQYTLPDFPAYRGYDTGTLAFDNSAAPVDPTPYNYTLTTPLNWFTPAFLCRRGGLRYKYVYVGDTSQNQLMSVSREAEPVGYTASVLTNGGGASESAAAALATGGMIDTSAGMIVTQVQQNPVLEVELPFFSNLRFFPARKKNFNSAGQETNKFHRLLVPKSTTATSSKAYAFVSTGEDFSLSFFQAVPVFWNRNTPSPSPFV
jgi:hypothetical protein